MGSPAAEPGRYADEGPVHQVTILEPFAVGVYEVTRGEFGHFVRDTSHAAENSCRFWDGARWVVREGRNWLEPGFRQTDRDPVTCVSWRDARAYAAWLGARTGQRYRLLSEAEWEYAARGGTRTARYWQDRGSSQCLHANGADLTAKQYNAAWQVEGCHDGHYFTAPAGSFTANRFGLHDVLGNVWEWTQDCWIEGYAAAPGDGQAQESGACDRRVLRGGGWNSVPQDLRSAARGKNAADNRGSNLGFRVARALPRSPAAVFTGAGGEMLDLHFMARATPTQIAALLAGGADPNGRDRDGWTALMLAASSNADPAVTATLLARGADPNLADGDGWTALMLAALFNDEPRVTRALLAGGADPELRNHDGWTAAMLAELPQAAAPCTTNVQQDEHSTSLFYLLSDDVAQRDSCLDVVVVPAHADGGLEALTATVRRSVAAALDVPLVPEPELPPVRVVAKDPFENAQQFDVRIRRATQQRQGQIDDLRIEYRRAVEDRNRELQRRREALEMPSVVAASFAAVFGYPRLRPVQVDVDGAPGPKYDAEEEKLFVDLSWSRKYRRPAFSGEISIDLPAAVGGEAARAYRRLLSGSLDYRLRFRIDQDRIALEGVELLWPGGAKQYAARFDGSEVVPSSQRVVLTHASSGSDTARLQNPNLKDTLFEEWKAQEVRQFDDDIPELLAGAAAAPPDDRLWLFAIGIEKYAATADISYSRRSAELFVETVRKRLGVPAHHVFALYDEQASSGLIMDKLALMNRRMAEERARNPAGEMRLLFYYSGHGVPAIDDDNEPYLMPSDRIPDFVSRDSAFRARDFYRGLSELPADSVVAFMDSCFTGETDGRSVFEGKVAASRLSPRKVSFDEARMAVITAGTERQFSSALPLRGHRLFSYYVIKSLLGGARDVGGLYREVNANVHVASRELGGTNEQDPVLVGNANLAF